jgi:hypothetical protein
VQNSLSVKIELPPQVPPPEKLLEDSQSKNQKQWALIDEHLEE